METRYQRALREALKPRGENFSSQPPPLRIAQKVRNRQENIYVVDPRESQMNMDESSVRSHCLKEGAYTDGSFLPHPAQTLLRTVGRCIDAPPVYDLLQRHCEDTPRGQHTHFRHTTPNRTARDLTDVRDSKLIEAEGGVQYRLGSLLSQSCSTTYHCSRHLSHRSRDGGVGQKTIATWALQLRNDNLTEVIAPPRKRNAACARQNATRRMSWVEEVCEWKLKMGLNSNGEEYTNRDTTLYEWDAPRYQEKRELTERNTSGRFLASNSPDPAHSHPSSASRRLECYKRNKGARKQQKAIDGEGGPFRTEVFFYSPYLRSTDSNSNIPSKINHDSEEVSCHLLSPGNASASQSPECYVKQSSVQINHDADHIQTPRVPTELILHSQESNARAEAGAGTGWYISLSPPTTGRDSNLSVESEKIL